MSAKDTFKAGILGDPYDPNKKPSRNLAVQGFSELQDQVDDLSDDVQQTEASIATLTNTVDGLNTIQSDLSFVAGWDASSGAFPASTSCGTVLDH